jgi:hypothetical protein
MRLTEHFYRRLRRFELVPGHMGEEVMLNLIVQAAKPEVCRRERSDIPGRKDLLSESIQSDPLPSAERRVGCPDAAPASAEATP